MTKRISSVITLALMLVSGCAKNDEQTYDNQEFLNEWWLITSASQPYAEYENKSCFYVADDHYFYVMEIGAEFYYELTWTQVDVNKYDISDLFVATVNEIPETKKIDWDIDAVKFPLSGEIIAEECPEIQFSM